MAIDAQDIIEDLQTFIQKNNYSGAKDLLAGLGVLDDKGQKKIFDVLLKADIAFTIPLLLELRSISADADFRLLLGEMITMAITPVPERVQELITSSRVIDLKPLVDLIGDAVPRQMLAEGLCQCLHQEQETERIIPILQAMGASCSPAVLPDLTNFLYSERRDLVRAAIKALGATRQPAAVTALVARMHSDADLDSLILAQCAEIGDEGSIMALCVAMASNDVFLRTYAKKELATIGAVAAPYIHRNLTSNNVDLVIHSLNVLGDIADSCSIEPIRKLLDTMVANANIRFAAYEALSLLPIAESTGLYTLAAGLSDPDEQVRFAAARAVEQNISPRLILGIKNLLKGAKKEVRVIVRSIIDAEVEKLFGSLCIEPEFVEYALPYLALAHPETRKRCCEIWRKIGEEEIVARIQESVSAETVRPKIVAVDDSRMILTIYKSSLYELGYEPVLFEYPASALAWLEREKPLAVLTDLYMPEINGIELSRQIRAHYSKIELPIMIVTTQNEQQDHRDPDEVWENYTLHKPFTTKGLGEAIIQLLAG